MILTTGSGPCMVLACSHPGIRASCGAALFGKALRMCLISSDEVACASDAYLSFQMQGNDGSMVNDDGVCGNGSDQHGKRCE